MPAFQVTTLARAKDRVNAALAKVAPEADAMLADLIAAVTLDVQGPEILNTPLDRRARTWVVPVVNSRHTTLSLPWVPVKPGTVVLRESPTRAFADADPIPTTDYFVDHEAGLVHWDIYTPADGRGTLQVQAVAGLADGFDLAAVSPAVARWEAATAYAAPTQVRPTALHGDTGLTYVPSTDGTSGATEPDWPTEEDAVVEDGTVVWVPARVYLLQRWPQLVEGASRWVAELYRRRATSTVTSKGGKQAAESKSLTTMDGVPPDILRLMRSAPGRAYSVRG